MSDPILAISPLGATWQTLDPFLFSVHHHDRYPAGNEQLGPLPTDEHVHDRNRGRFALYPDGKNEERG